MVLNEKRDINLDIYDITGKLVSQQKEGRLSIGQNEVAIPTINLANGTYVVKIWSKEDGVIASVKMVVMN